MALRQNGRRVKRGGGAGRRHDAKGAAPRNAPRNQRRGMGKREKHQLVQMMVCSGCFVLLVLTKLVLPNYMEQVNRTISGALSQNMDVQAVFSSVGKAFSGEVELAKTADEVYRAVFYPDESAASEVWVRVSGMEDRQVLEFLKQEERVREDPSIINDAEPEVSETDELAYILYSNQTLPENASMEQALLGFDYTSPLSGTLSSGFGYREHPTEGEERFHYGVDLVADSGTDICSFADGTVTVVGESNSYGNYCVVVHENGCSTLYAHCSRIVAMSGKTVEKGETIAKVGETGMATGPHLHFELQQDGVYLNPIYYVAKP